MKFQKRYVVFPFLIAALQICSLAQNNGSSLGDVARKLRDQKAPEPRVVSAADAKQLFSDVDTIMSFASTDSGYPKRLSVKRRLLNRDELDQMYKTAWSKIDGFDDRIKNSELVLKKFGLLPQNFEMGNFLVKNVTRSVGGLYRYDDKTMYLMNWVPMEEQRTIMAHELTHALQDQNYDLKKFMVTSSNNKPSMATTEADISEQSATRRAVVEGQAMLVYMDYLINKNVTKEQLAQLSYMDGMKLIQQRLQDYESPVTFKNAPLVFSATAMFPYREGLAFELDVLSKSRSKAFAGMFARPPRSTYEILEPEAYLEAKKIPAVFLPDLSPVLGDKYEPYDSGAMGEFDIQIMTKEFGRDNDIYTVAQKWNGGSYIVVKQNGATENSKLTTKDLALIYVSRWRSHAAAVRFTEIYQKSLAKHLAISSKVLYDSTCKEGEEDECPGLSFGALLETDEGPVSLEVWGGNTVLISQSFSRETLRKLRPLVLSPNKAKAENKPNLELHQKLYGIDEFVALQESYATELIRHMLSTN